MKIISSLVILSAIVAAVSAQTQQSTPAPTTVKPVATTQAPATTKAAATPAPTTAKPVTATKPEVTTSKPAATPASSTTKQAAGKKGVFSVSVERDATYSIEGPICSGRGKEPAGKNCPKKGDVAVASCLAYLPSYTASGKCVAPMDAVCKVIHTGAWGCAWSSGNGSSSNNRTMNSSTTSANGGGKGGKDTKPTPLPTKTNGGKDSKDGKTTPKPTTKSVTPSPTKNGTAGGNKTTNSTAAPTAKSDNGTVQAPTKLTNLAIVEAGSSSAMVVGAVAAVAAVAAAAIGTVLYKKSQKKTTESMISNEAVDVVTP